MDRAAHSGCTSFVGRRLAVDSACQRRADRTAAAQARQVPIRVGKAHRGIFWSFPANALWKRSNISAALLTLAIYT